VSTVGSGPHWQTSFVDDTVVDAATVDVAGNRVTIIDLPETLVSARVTLVIRPEAVRLSRESGTLKGKVRRAMFLGNLAEYLVTVDGDWLVDSPNPVETELFDAGGPICLSLSPSLVHVLPSRILPRKCGGVGSAANTVCRLSNLSPMLRFRRRAGTI
jgi:ABC-type Fe3+/spermidine/putrescine transport system ATPase subunit